MSEQMEKLLHEKGGVLDLVWAFVYGKIGIEPVIARIVKAVLDGDLDEMLGVVGRGEMNIADLGLYIASCKNLEVDRSVVDIIALRREEEK